MVEQDLIPLIDVLCQIQDDITVPKAVRIKIKTVIEALHEEGDLKIKANKALQGLDDISNDPNIPSYVRPQIWNVVSLLENF